MTERSSLRAGVMVPAVATAIAAGAFVLYAILAARDIMFGDGPELTAAAITNGVAHPPGYPLWIMLGHGASLLPVGTLPFRVNLTAAAYHACTVGFVFASAYLLTRRIAAAVFAAAALALGSPIFVTWSLQAEVFSLNDLFASAIVLLCVLWLDDPSRVWTVPLLGLTFGLGLENQQSLLLLSPLPMWVAYRIRGELPTVARCCTLAASSIGLLLAGFALPYVHVLLVSQHLVGYHLGSARTFGALIDVIDRRVFGTFNLVPGIADQGGTAIDRIVAALEADGWPAALIGIGCLGFAVRRRWDQFAIALLIVAFPFGAFSAMANIDVTDESLRSIFQRFALLSLTAASPFAAGVWFLFERIPLSRGRAAVGASALVVCLVAGTMRLPHLSLADAHDPRRLYRDVSRALPARAILLTAGDSVDGPPLYFVPIEHWRPDVTVVAYGQLNIASYRAALSATIAVPPLAGEDVAPQLRRDVLAAANAGRPFFVAGERGLHAPGPLDRAIPQGIVSRVLSPRMLSTPVSYYRNEVALQSAPGYGRIDVDRWRSNGFGSDVRGYYAGGLFSTGYHAEELGQVGAARSWYRAAGRYSTDPLIATRLAQLR